MSFVTAIALALVAQTSTPTVAVDAGRPARQVFRPGQKVVPLTPPVNAVSPDAGRVPEGGVDAAVIAAPPAPKPPPRPPVRKAPVRARPDAGFVADASVPDVPDVGVALTVDAATPDAGLATAPAAPSKEPTVPGWLLELVERARTPPAIDPPVGPDQGPPMPVEAAEPFSALWLALALILLVFGGLRVAAFFVGRAARRETGWALALSRGWLFVEAIVWLLVAVWLVNRFFFAQTGLTATLITGIVLLVVALGFGPLRDVLAGLVLSMERPFGVGDRVQIGDEAGRVVAFHLRVLELSTSSQETLRIPYRRVAESTSARSAVPRRAHPVRRSFGLPEGVDPAEALKTAKELALASPWAVLGFAPEVELERGDDGEQLRVVAFAFATEAESWLAADLEAGWREASRRWSQN